MEITDIKIRKFSSPESGRGRLRAVVSVTFDNELVVHDIKVIQNEHKRFIAMPSRQMEDGNYRDIVHPIHPEMRGKLQEAILGKYAEVLELAALELGRKDELQKDF